MMEKHIYKILVLNPGSTSTKVAYYENEQLIHAKSLEYDADVLNGFKRTMDQFDMRFQSILDYIQESGIDPKQLDAIAARGSLGKKLKGGGYEVSEAMVNAHRSADRLHAALLGAVLADALVKMYPNIKAYIYDAPGLNEGDPICCVTGAPLVPADPGGHTLNQRAVGHLAAEKMGIPYSQANIIVQHMGGGVTTGAHHNGRIIDYAKGAFSADRPGDVPPMNLVKLCYSGKYTEQELMRELKGNSGLAGYLGTTDLREVERRIDSGDKEAKFYFDAMAYQLVKDIGTMTAVLKGKVDCIALTGGMAHSKRLTDQIADYVHRIAPVLIFPGAFEEEALAKGVLRILRGEEPVNTDYPENP